MDTVFSFLVSIFLALFLPGAETPPQQPEAKLATATATVVRIIDGDTIEVLQNQEELIIRYIGIDTPESYRDGLPECFSKEATAANTALVAGKIVSLVPDTELTDKYNRQLRYVYVDGLFVNEVLVAQGYAMTLSIKPNRRFAERFSAAQQTARAQNIGLWKSCK